MSRNRPQGMPRTTATHIRAVGTLTIVHSYPVCQSLPVSARHKIATAKPIPAQYFFIIAPFKRSTSLHCLNDCLPQNKPRSRKLSTVGFLCFVRRCLAPSSDRNNCTIGSSKNQGKKRQKVHIERGFDMMKLWKNNGKSGRKSLRR